jgi:hyperosmotically inducible protein
VKELKRTAASIKGERTMKALYSLALAITATALLAIGVPAHATKMDDRIESSARKSYVFKTYLKEDDIKIESKDGAVILTGVVSHEYHKALAQETMAGLPGVKSVDNRLELRGAEPTANSDAWLKDKVMVTLLFHQSVSAATEIDVKDGIVTLRGHAVSQSQKELTTEYTKDVEGVKDVNNEMTVSKAPKKKAQTVGKKMDDASITAQVKMALLLHRSTSALNTTVRTKRGVVTVGGKAKNTAEKNLVARIVKDINGVKSVTNRMTIE